MQVDLEKWHHLSRHKRSIVCVRKDISVNIVTGLVGWHSESRAQISTTRLDNCPRELSSGIFPLAYTQHCSAQQVVRIMFICH